MRVDVIICTYNRIQQLVALIRSIIVCKVPLEVSVTIIVVDNNSSDETNDIVNGLECTSRIALKYIFEERQGKSYALNAALKQIAGDIVAFCDDDQTVDPSYLQEIAKAFESYPQYNCFGGKVLALYPENMPKWLDIENSMKFLRSAFCDRDDGDLEIEYGTRTISKLPGGGNMFFRKEAIEKNGPFRTDLGPVGGELGFSEDTEYCQRLLQRGEKFMYIPSAIVYHPVHEDRLRKEYLLKWQYKCGMSEVRRNGGYKGAKKVFGVPRYLYRKFIQHAAKWVFSVQTQKRFYHRLRLYYACGEMVEHMRIGFKTIGDQENQ